MLMALPGDGYRPVGGKVLFPGRAGGLRGKAESASN